MSDQKIVFFDIDGTLYNDEKELPASTKEAILELKAQGVYVAIATGRSPFMFSELKNELKIDTFVSFNGQFVVCNDKIIYKNPHKREELIELEQVAIKNEHPIVFMDDTRMVANVDSHPYVNESIQTLKVSNPRYDPSYYLKKEIYQALLFCDVKAEEEYVKKFPNFNLIRWHKYSTDVLPAGGSKARGIDYVLDHLGFTKENSYAFGDGLNDIEMLQHVGTGVAMGNSSEALKQVADFVTKNVEEDGIIHGLKEVGLL